MARRKPRPPQLSYNPKRKQLNKVGVKLPLPTSPSNKGMITRYHNRILGPHGLLKSFDIYKGAKKKLVNEFNIREKKGLPRFPGALIPKGSKFVNVTNKFLTIEKENIRMKIALINKKDLIDDPIGLVNKLPDGRRRWKLMIGGRLLPGTFEAGGILSDELISISVRSGEEIVKRINIVQVTPIQQASNGEFKKARGN